MTPQPPAPRPGAELNAARAADFEETPQVKIKRLERTLADERKYAVKSTTQLHKALVKDLNAAEKRATVAEKRAEAAEKRAAAAQGRAETAERQVAIMKRSTTWRAGRAVVAVPGKIKRMGRS